ncbi:hypothetical protein Lfu02_55290 [Longispora fulva]|uniref:Uncharacterized protein n=1 Tax=Longispora fulva TaxID=619741 RepID=A0A8J7KGK8_9ACTN|nr:hypothetical protein [Longispora fulva]MBG6137490.1 hypothetical protein [Longispora fulva]GIG61157.1 hypothetical protein Lfu02_55290 [Longispora fulva]
MSEDPFENVPDGTGYTVTLKEGTGYDAAWIVVRAKTADDVTEELKALVAAKLHENVKKVAALFRGGETAKPAAAAKGGGYSKPQGSGKPSSGRGGGGSKEVTVLDTETGEYCEHGEMTLVQGWSDKVQRTYKQLRCPERNYECNRWPS